MNAMDQDFFRSLIEDRRESFFEWLSVASEGGNGRLPNMQAFEQALERVDRDRYGPCSECDGQVEPELLAAMPTATICLDCLEAPQRRQLEADLQLAQEVNRSLLPRRIPRDGLVDVGVHYAPSRFLSGDFYDLIVHPGSHRVGLAAGDVVGKGIAAGLLRAGLQATLRVLAGQRLGPARLLDRANSHFLDSSQPGRLASVFYGVLQPERGTLVYANGGHPPPLLRRASGQWTALETTGTLLGVIERAKYREIACEIEPGDLLVLYTDGVTEAENRAGEFFEEPMLRRAVDRMADAPAQELADHVAAELGRFAPGEPSDDRTLIVLRRVSNGTPS